MAKSNISSGGCQTGKLTKGFIDTCLSLGYSDGMRLKILSAMGIALILACSFSIPNELLAPTDAPLTLETTLTSPTPPPTPAPTLAPTPIPALRIESGDLALFYGDWELAVQEFERALLSTDEEVQAAALLGLGKAWKMGRNSYQAVKYLENVTLNYAQYPQSILAYVILGQIYDAEERYAEAAAAYDRYIKLRPGLVDGYILNMLGEALYNAGHYALAANEFLAALTAPSTLDAEVLQLKQARSLAMAEDYATALVLYDDLLNRTSNEQTRALIDFRKYEIHTALDQPDLAQQVCIDAVNNYPTAGHAFSCLAALVEAGVPVDELQRGIVDYYAGQYGAALAALDRYLQSNPANPGSAYYFSGLTQRALGGYEDAIKQWDILITQFAQHPYWDKAWEEKAYTQWAYQMKYDEAISTMETFVEKHPTHARAGEFLYDASLVAERAKEYQKAAETFERVINLYPGFEQAPRALFLAGINYYLLKNYSTALLSFMRFSDSVHTLEDRAMAQFWIAKSEEALGSTEEARKSWEKTAEIDPTGYYSERARDILLAVQPFQAPSSIDLAYDLDEERVTTEDWIRTTFGLPGDLELNTLGNLAIDPRVQRGMELWELGLWEDARAEFEAVRLEFATDPANSYRLANALLDLGLYRPAILAARQVLDLAGLDDAQTVGAPAYFNHVRFGIYYQSLVQPLAEEYQFHPLFIYAMMRQESLFEGFVHSTAGALGLLQIMPATGIEIANNLGWPAYDQEDLLLPYVNLKFGLDYLATQRTRFDGDYYAALAAYNGGPGNAYEWKQVVPDDPDLYLEIIRFPETRKYIRGVYELFSLYRLIYGRSP